MQEICRENKKFVVGITGASGIRLGIRFITHLARFVEFSEIFVVFSEGSKMVAQYEEKIADILSDSRLKNMIDLSDLKGDSNANDADSQSDSNANGANLKGDSQINRAKITLCDDGDLDSPISSGSFGVESTLIIPCSANTLAKIACGISDTLITRAALVALKERKDLLLAPREMPLNAIMLQNMLTLSHLGAIIAPPMLSYYANSESLEAMEDFMCGKWLDCIGIRHNLFPRWGENNNAK